MQIDGMDVLAVRGAATSALEWVRGGNGRCCLVKTDRYRGHSMSDPAKYRSRDEVQAVREKSDPIEAVKRDLEAIDCTEDELKAIDRTSGRSSARPRTSPSNRPSPIPASFIPTSWSRPIDELD